MRAEETSTVKCLLTPGLTLPPLCCSNVIMYAVMRAETDNKIKSILNVSTRREFDEFHKLTMFGDEMTSCDPVTSDTV